MMLNLVFLAAQALALQPVSSDGGVFGLAPGIYKGSGELQSQAWYVPDLQFASVREISQGIITAKTDAKLMGASVAAAQAKLKVVPTATGFDMIDLATGAKAGQGGCNETQCSFSATVMNGELTLNETWVPTAAGFNVTNASQLFKGLPANYEASFVRVR